MELAGLEPATSWVRFRRKPLRPFASLCGLAQQCCFCTIRFATVCASLLRLVDQKMTTHDVTRCAQVHGLERAARPERCPLCFAHGSTWRTSASAMTDCSAVTASSSSIAGDPGEEHAGSEAPARCVSKIASWPSPERSAAAALLAPLPRGRRNLAGHLWPAAAGIGVVAAAAERLV